MTVMRSAFLAAFGISLAFLTLTASAGAVDGGSFQTITGPWDPEEYVTQVNLAEDQELVAVDEQHAAVRYEDGPQAFLITAAAAHDSEGAAVPASLTVTQPNLVTLTVHHRDGNPVAGGAPFVYPISAGVGWDGEFRTYPVVIPPPEKLQAPPTCVVPELSGRSLRASRRVLHRAHCKLGRVRGERSRSAHVVQQYRLAGKSLPIWTAVDVKTS